MFGVEVKPQGKRKFKRLSVSIPVKQIMCQEAHKYVLQHCKDHAIDPSTTDWRVINRNTDSIIALGKQLVIH